MYQENTSDEWDIIHGYTTRKGCITILYHAIENIMQWPDGKVGCDTVELH